MRRRFALLSAALLACSAQAALLKLKFAEFDPNTDFIPIPLALRASGSGDRHMIVQCKPGKAPATFASLRSISQGRLEYLPDSAWVIKLSEDQIARLRASTDISFVGDFDPAYKLDPELGTRGLQLSVSSGAALLGSFDMVVTLHVGESPSGLNTQAKILSVDPCGPRWLVLLRGTYADAFHLAQQDKVAFIEDASVPQLRNDVTKWVIQSNQNGMTPIWDRGIIGQNMIAGLIDTKMYMNHNAFRDPINNTAGPNHRKVVMYNSNSGQSGGDTHGTHTAGTLAGDREPIDGQTFRNGMAYKARIAFTNLSDITGSNLYSKLSTAYAAGARDNSNSWGDDSTRQYTSWCQQLDQFSWDFEDSLVAFAVSNGSVCTTPENAKSVLAVGASQQAPNQQSHGSGGTGPTIDGRRKPEIYAPGIGIFSAQTGTTNGYVSLSGTSMASPAITGGCVLIRQWLREGYSVNGTKQGPAFVPPITGALIRALALNSTVDMTGISGYPSNSEGWGRMLLDNVLSFSDETQKTIPWTLRNSNGMTAGDQRQFSIQVLGSDSPLKITMSFTDFPAAVFATDPVVNNVDLEVVAPDGTVYLGNQFANGESVAGGAPDPKNSTEMVLVKNPQVGTWRIRVKVVALNNGAGQGFGLAASGHIQRSTGGS